MCDELVLSHKDPVDAFVTLTMNRPDKMNAMSQALGNALAAAIVRAGNDPEVRAVISTRSAQSRRRAALSTPAPVSGRECARCRAPPGR
ncbi:MAG: hypothetical protein LPK12_01895 [Rhodobacterales bacterium]|nr:hypothetical protein [Rhodobacterales bacterium]MDX5498695.1 hypothetical protein [Rhodobacterales bacterium]